MPEQTTNPSDPEKAGPVRSVEPELVPLQEPAPSPGQERNTVQLRNAGALLVSDANDVASDMPTTLIVLVGDAECGKTTLLSAIYINFLQGPYQEVRFAGSRTFFAFEQRSFLALGESGIHQPSTPRTLYGERQTFLHLSLARDGGTSVSLLIGDMSGEYFDRAVDNLDELKKLEFIRRVDCLTVMVDGAKAADHQARHVARARTRQLLRRVLEAGFVRQGQVQVVVTKWDRIAHAGLEATEFAEGEAAELAEVARNFGCTATVSKTAARSDYPDLVTPGLGVYDLLKSWMAPSSGTEPHFSEAPSPKPFDLYRVE